VAPYSMAVFATAHALYQQRAQGVRALDLKHSWVTTYPIQPLHGEVIAMPQCAEWLAKPSLVVTLFRTSTNLRPCRASAILDAVVVAGLQYLANTRGDRRPELAPVVLREGVIVWRSATACRQEKPRRCWNRAIVTTHPGGPFGAGR